MEFPLKQRLIGAVVLVALAVIFIPMLLEGPKHNLVPDMEPLPIPEDQPLSQPLQQFPDAEEIPARPEVSVVQPDTPASAAAPATGDGAPAAGTTAPAAPPLAEPAPPPAEETAAGAEPGVLGNWVVQVGSFSDEQNALRLRDKLRKAHFATQVERVDLGGKTHFRVRVGPYLERAEAEAEQKKLSEAFTLKGRVLAYP